MDIVRAAREGNEPEVIRWLNADPTLVEQADADGVTLLSVAARHGHFGVVRLLVERGANTNATGWRGMMALHHAAQEGHEEVVEFLLSKVAQANSRDDEGRDALFLASVRGHLAVVRLLIQHLGAHDLDGEDDEGWTALHLASQEGHEELVAFLLGKGAQASKCNSDGRTPLLLASMAGRLRVVRLLVQHSGVQGLEAKDNQGCTALQWASEEGDCEVAAFLLSKGAQASTRDTENETPLMSACRRGHIGGVRLLFQHMGAAGLKDRDDDGMTALHNAAFWGNDEILRFLLLAGADHTMTDNEGKTPRALAEEEEEEEEEEHDDKDKEGKVRCVAVLEWWDGELERRVVLHRATCLHKSYTMRRDMPTSQVPTYLKARVAAGHAVPSVEVVSPQSERRFTRSMARTAEASGKSKAAGERDDAQIAIMGEEERYAMLEFVVKALNEALVTELLEGFH